MLVVDDDESLRRVLEFQLAEAGYQVLSAADGESALDLFTSREVACLLTDLRMPGLSGLDLVRRAGAIQPDTPSIVLTAFGDTDTAVEALRAGAFDYVTKPFNRDEVLLAIEKALTYGRALSENRNLRRLVHARFRIAGIVGESTAIRRVLDLVERVAASDVTVVVTGESGTGKELVARAIHSASARARMPFIALNCAAIPETLIESELFGYRRGAFTGATDDRKGTFEEATGGTLFLDEVSAMPASLQAKVLRVLQEHEVVRVGESRSRPVDVRIVVATNRRLLTMVEEGSFREDLYFRLAVVPIELPPLRERREDIPLLAELFLTRAVERHGHASMRMDREVYAALSSYAWPGNVRELENTIERMVVLGNDGTLTVDDVPDNVRRRGPTVAGIGLELPEGGLSIDAVEREIIRQSLARHDGNQTRTARYLHITRSALIYRMQKFGLTDEPTSSAAERDR